MNDIIVQAGHASWTSSSGRAYPVGGGAPGEADWAWKLAHLIAARLAAHGVGCTIVGQWYGLPVPPEATLPAAVFLSLHYDAAIYGAGNNTGCFAGRGSGDPSGALADQLVNGWNASYPAATGIPLHLERNNPNVQYYYAFSATRADVPGVLLEHGCGSPVPTGGFPRGQDSVFLHEQIEQVADADVAAILAHLVARGLLPAPPVPVPPIPPTPPIPPEDFMILTGAQQAAVQAALWGEHWNPAAADFAIPAAWREEWKAGRYRGRPVGAEQPIPASEDKPAGQFQAFDAGVACWLPGEQVSWNG